MTTEARVMSITAKDYAALFIAIGRWAKGQAPGLVVASVTTVPTTGRAGVTALVVFTTGSGPAVADVAVEQSRKQGRRDFRPAIEAYFNDRVSTGADPATITGTDAAHNTGAAESTARNILADLKRSYQQSQDGAQ